MMPMVTPSGAAASKSRRGALVTRRNAIAISAIMAARRIPRSSAGEGLAIRRDRFESALHHHPGGIAHGDGVGGDVGHDHAINADNRAFPDGDSFQNVGV